jgi:hypothetical protein
MPQKVAKLQYVTTVPTSITIPTITGYSVGSMTVIVINAIERGRRDSALS